MGGVGFCCATASTVHAPMRPATMPPASARSLKVNKDIDVPPAAVSLFPRFGKTIRCRLRVMDQSQRHCTLNSIEVDAFKRSEHREKVGATLVVARLPA